MGISAKRLPGEGRGHGSKRSAKQHAARERTQGKTYRPAAPYHPGTPKLDGKPAHWRGGRLVDRAENMGRMRAAKALTYKNPRFQ